MGRGHVVGFRWDHDGLRGLAYYGGPNMLRSILALRPETLCVALLALGCDVAGAEPANKRPKSAASARPAIAANTASPAKPKLAPSATALPAASVGEAANPAASAPVVTAGGQCREQSAQDFLLRKGQLAKIGAPPEVQQKIEAARKRAIDYRTRQYGRFPGFGSRSDNPHPPQFYAKRTKFFGHMLVLHRKVVPALACVEAALKRDCTKAPYHPRHVSGLRLENTYKDYEISNHVYGMALDIDSDRNPCCGCVGKWSENPLCKKEVKSVYERMVMPRCWVEVFERFGFYWLGHDELQDTMHFEFLGDPDRIIE